MEVWLLKICSAESKAAGSLETPKFEGVGRDAGFDAPDGWREGLLFRFDVGFSSSLIILKQVCLSNCSTVWSVWNAIMNTIDWVA